MSITADNLIQLLGGLGLFLYGMYILETTLKEFAGRTFKLFLREHTKRKAGAILSGTLATSVLQSSSVVTFMVLAFVGAGILTMRNALAVVMGANLGTTISNWMVALLGFHLALHLFSLVAVALGAGGVVFAGKWKKARALFFIILGLGFLFLGLEQMKIGMESSLKDFDFTFYQGYSRIIFVLLGLVLTAIIQSSSATVAITLSALNTGVLPLDVAIAVVIGSELGTSLKSIFGAVTGSSDKKRVVAGNLSFNLTLTVLGYLALSPLTHFIQNVIGLRDPLLILVCFQSLLNLAGILLFFPLLGPFSGFLEKRFAATKNPSVAFIHRISPGATGQALQLMEKETGLFLHRVLLLNLDAFQAVNKHVYIPPALQPLIEQQKKKLPDNNDKYADLKKAEGEILVYFSKMKKGKTGHAELGRMNHLLEAVRSAMYSAKGLRDVKHDRNELRNSANEQKYTQYLELRSSISRFYGMAGEILGAETGDSAFKKLVGLYHEARKQYDERMDALHDMAGKQDLLEQDISTLLNVNRQLFSSAKAVIFALGHYLLDEREYSHFEKEAGDIPAW